MSISGASGRHKVEDILSKIKNKVKYWLLPEGIINLYSAIRTIDIRGRALCRPNSRFKGMHQGKRCFILCNGPSVNKQNLLLLKNEIVFSVSSGYLHKDYLAIQPRYHCLTPLYYYKDLTAKDAILWFQEMDAKVGRAELFFGTTQEPLIRKNKLFQNTKINYIYAGLLSNESDDKIIDISKKIPGIISVPVLCMIIAMYMGFKEIYLLGLDNDWWRRDGEYKYFYEPTVLKGKGDATDENGKLKYPHNLLFVQFYGFADLLKQYWIIHNRARANNISIYNATEGGAVEEFPRVKFESLFRNKEGE